ncbi:pyruvate decarboxylase [Cladophialophora yegresii CBS 114405]|uniref:Pyruvate decarboxylase n=1 Tax=Cladophialophora yegresii CBS 114405 TaxID=1182544 RepID=W9W537_9EURO|nr:pyruvate decarboxylase [Cladophialophora yegresii CBS 114405]EXJ59651.1 pyruvate decarboxylase [Cladophialophora yegresii CBS 114405]
MATNSDIRTSELKEPVDVAVYLFTRLKQMGIDSVHGVPGDFNLVALDYLEGCGLKWVGNCNELNAGYAADGYARIKGGPADSHASFAEYVPVVHIVGTPSTISQKNGMLLHHTLGNGNFHVFADMAAHLAIEVAKLIDPRDIAAQIDHALRECFLQSRPVYLTLPTDMVGRKVEGSRLRTKLDLSPHKNEPEKEDYVVDVVLGYLSKAKNAVILVDSCAVRHRVLDETHELIEKSGLPVFVAPMGKGAVDETLPNFGGIYAGAASNPGVQDRVESADLLLTIGSVKSDFNTAGFSYRTSQLKTIDFHSTYTRVRYSEYPAVGMKGVLRKLIDKLPKLNIQSVPTPSQKKMPEDGAAGTSAITHSWFWPRLGNWLRDGDVVLTETGTANYGVFDTRFPKNVTNISQILWGSIGYATGSCQGVALALKESGGNRRTILFTGDGSFQLTCQEVSTMIRHNLNPIIFIICNNGYTIERFIHGMEAGYNDIQNWNYRHLLPAFGAKEGGYKTFQVRTKDEMQALLGDDNFSKAPYLQLVELYMPWNDAPAGLCVTAEASARNNARMLETS